MKWCKAKFSNVWDWCKNNCGIVLAVGLATLVGLAYIPLLNHGCLCWGEGWLVPKCKEDTDPIKTALALAGAVLVIANMQFIITRIRRTDTQIEKQEEQIEESKNTNFLNALHQGISMLYADNYPQQIGGVEHLHSLAEIAHKENKLERVEKVLEVFCVYVREVPAMAKIAQAETEVCVMPIYKNRQEEAQEELKTVRKEEKEEEKKKVLQIKRRILVKIVPLEEDSKIYHKYREKINLEGADLSKLYFREIQLQGIQLQGVKLQGADLQKANLQDAKLQSANLRNTVLSGAELQGADLRNTDSWGEFYPLHGADLSYANLQEALLSATNLHHVDLEGAFLHNAVLRGANLWYSEEQLALGARSDSRETNLKKAKLHGADLTNTILSEQMRWQEAELNYALIDFHYKKLIDGLAESPLNNVRGVNDVIWVHENLTRFSWKGWGEIEKEKLISELKKEAISSKLYQRQIEKLIEHLLNPEYFPDNI